MSQEDFEEQYTDDIREMLRDKKYATVTSMKINKNKTTWFRVIWFGSLAVAAIALVVAFTVFGG